jgi:DNA ligase 1
MPDLNDGESVEMQGSPSRPYVLKNVGGVCSCSCPAWRNQSLGIERRTCKHLRRLRGEAAEAARLGGALPIKLTETRGDRSAPALLRAASWDRISDPTGWWLSEKLDGVRAYWDGRQFLSRQGNLYHAPDWFVAGLPNVPGTAQDRFIWHEGGFRRLHPPYTATLSFIILHFSRGAHIIPMRSAAARI